jgi:tRNA modification GTPase
MQNPMPDHPFEQDTIVAISTPPGRGGIGIVRLSGPQPATMMAPVLKLRNPLVHGRARFAEVIDTATGQLLDQSIVTLFAAPQSYTGEDVLEISTHGAPVLLDYLVRSALSARARLAEPGEFTQRAFLAGKLDLTQAEAIHDLVAASTLQQARVAASQLGGSVSKAIAPAKDALLNLIAALEAGIDFAEDDIDLLPDAAIATQIDVIATPLEAMQRSFAYGRTVRDGVTIAIVGRPNAGKSTLFNRLLGRERAIVTAHPGTTRDLVTDWLEIAGVPVELVDTAGLREAPSGPEGEAESHGIARTRTTLAEAHLAVMVIDASESTPGMHPEDQATLETLRSRPYLVVLNKTDQADELAVSRLSQKLAESNPIPASAATGAGISTLVERIAKHLTQGRDNSADGSLVITSLRQQQAIEAALHALNRTRQALQQSLPHEFLLLDLGAALAALDELTGTTSADEVLHRIFASFCIGK